MSSSSEWQGSLEEDQLVQGLTSAALQFLTDVSSQVDTSGLPQDNHTATSRVARLVMEDVSEQFMPKQMSSPLRLGLVHLLRVLLSTVPTLPAVSAHSYLLMLRSRISYFLRRIGIPQG